MFSGTPDMKIKSYSNNNFSVNKTLELHNMIIAIAPAFHECSKYANVYKNDVSEGTDVKKSASKEYIIWHYFYFSNKEFRFQRVICSGCHDVLMINIILNIHGVSHHCIVNKLGKVSLWIY